MIFAGLTYVWLFLSALFALTLLNAALLKVDPTQYSVEGPRPLIAAVVYTLSTFLLGSAGGMAPSGELAYALQLLGAFTGILIVAGGGLNIVATYLRERDDTATKALVADVQREADQQAARFAKTYDLSPDEAYEKLRELGAAAAALVGFLVQAVPQVGTSDPNSSAGPPAGRRPTTGDATKKKPPRRGRARDLGRRLPGRRR